MKLTRKDIQFIIICIGAIALVIISAHLIWPPKHQFEGTPITQTEVAEYKYVASLSREPFHYPDCKWAQKISPSNLVGFKTREEAIKAGHRPCKVCKP